MTVRIRQGVIVASSAALAAMGGTAEAYMMNMGKRATNAISNFANVHAYPNARIISVKNGCSDGEVHIREITEFWHEWKTGTNKRKDLDYHLHTSLFLETEIWNEYRKPLLVKHMACLVRSKRQQNLTALWKTFQEPENFKVATDKMAMQSFIILLHLAEEAVLNWSLEDIEQERAKVSNAKKNCVEYTGRIIATLMQNTFLNAAIKVLDITKDLVFKNELLEKFRKLWSSVRFKTKSERIVNKVHNLVNMTLVPKIIGYIGTLGLSVIEIAEGDKKNKLAKLEQIRRTEMNRYDTNYHELLSTFWLKNKELNVEKLKEFYVVNAFPNDVEVTKELMQKQFNKKQQTKRKRSNALTQQQANILIKEQMKKEQQMKKLLLKEQMKKLNKEQMKELLLNEEQMKELNNIKEKEKRAEAEKEIQLLAEELKAFQEKREEEIQLLIQQRKKLMQAEEEIQIIDKEK